MKSHGEQNIIHPSAILDGNISMGHRNTIGPNVVLRGNIELGDDNVIDAGVNLENNVRLGHRNHLYPYVVIGTAAEMGAKGDRLIADTWVEIWNDVTIREFSCVNAPFYFPSTTIEDKVYIMNKCYVAHDCTLAKGAILSAGVLLGGRCVIGAFSNLGLGVTVHQRIHIGSKVMVGMQTVITKDILPYSLVAGNPARIFRFNRVGAERSGLDADTMLEMENVFGEGLEKIHEIQNPAAKEIVEFLHHHPNSLLERKKKSER